MLQSMKKRRKAVALETFVWNDASEPSKGGILFIPGKTLKVRITDEATWTKWKSEGNRAYAKLHNKLSHER